jgi:hypothetical protein
MTSILAAGLPGNNNSKRKVGGIDTAAARAVCDSRGDRLGSYKRVFDRWLAVDRLGKPIGQFSSEFEAVDAISAAAGGSR